MLKTTVTSSLLALVLILMSVATAWAGTVMDMGILEGYPPVGEANWTAWRTEGVTTVGGPPNEILTEDNTGQIQNLGYSKWSDDEIPDWAIQVENFYYEGNGNEINMIFGGLGSLWSGTLWEHSFTWDGVFFNSVTDHGEIPTSLKTGACPVISHIVREENTKNLEFSGEPDTKYYLYRSQNPACDGCLYSDGHYLYLSETWTNSSGIGFFTDTSVLDSWYVVIKAGDSTTALGGCHSEEAHPTSVTVVGFEAVYSPFEKSIDLTWDSVTETGIMGFKVFRSQSSLSSKELLGQIAAQNPGSVIGSSYSYTDLDIQIGQSYHYWLEILQMDGKSEILGPVTEIAGYQIFLPISIR